MQTWLRQSQRLGRKHNPRQQGVVAVAAISTNEFARKRGARISKLAPETCDGERLQRKVASKVAMPPTQ
ncbi:uncharacterized protein DS421_6g198020 [Arachis hypogaea]|nr:uncharacterized protein DS421_6g198020 [Arachis hypogaea]